MDIEEVLNLIDDVRNMNTRVIMEDASHAMSTIRPVYGESGWNMALAELKRQVEARHKEESAKEPQRCPNCLSTIKDKKMTPRPPFGELPQYCKNEWHGESNVKGVKHA